MWNKTWQPLIDAGKLEVLGLVQEQHAERTKLYQQWKQYKWPIAQDALNLLSVKVVPLVIAIDEKGIVVSHNAGKQFITAWLAGETESPAGKSYSLTADPALDRARESLLWGDDDGLKQAITAYEKLIGSTHSKDPKAHFEIAVAYRNRFEQTSDAKDFQKAIDHWSTALKIDPNQYIYRRRIEQYGARLGKPYPFYDWVNTAIEEIKERGDQPIELTVPITGAEIAKPIRGYSPQKSVDIETAERVDSIGEDMIDVAVVAVPSAVRAGKASRVHVLLTPENVKWNNSGDKAVLMLYEVEGGQLAERQLVYAMPSAEQSTETRRFEFEVQLDKTRTDAVTVKGIALFGVCLDDSGICTYLKQPFEVTIDVTK